MATLLLHLPPFEDTAFLLQSTWGPAAPLEVEWSPDQTTNLPVPDLGLSGLQNCEKTPFCSLETTQSHVFCYTNTSRLRQAASQQTRDWVLNYEEFTFYWFRAVEAPDPVSRGLVSSHLAVCTQACLRGSWVSSSSVRTSVPSAGAPPSPPPLNLRPGKVPHSKLRLHSKPQMGLLIHCFVIWITQFMMMKHQNCLDNTVKHTKFL